MRRGGFTGVVLMLVAMRSAGLDGTAFFWYPSTVTNANGIWAVDIASGAARKVYDGVVSGAVLSPDGRRIAFGVGNKLTTMNNDGSDVQTHTTSVPFTPDRGQFDWSPGGVFWSRKPCVYRHDFVIGRTDTMAQYVCNTYPGKGYWGSADGRRAWCYMEILPADTTRTGHGDMAYISYGPDFSTCTSDAFAGVGYGHCITLDGRHVVVGWNDNTGLRFLGFEDGVEDTVISSKLPGGLISVAGINQCVNSNDYLLLRCVDNNYYLVNWTDQGAPVRVRAPSSDIYSGTVWLGALPDPRGATPAERDFAVRPGSPVRTAALVPLSAATVTLGGRATRARSAPGAVFLHNDVAIILNRGVHP